MLFGLSSRVIKSGASKGSMTCLKISHLINMSWVAIAKDLLRNVGSSILIDGVSTLMRTILNRANYYIGRLEG